MHKHFNSSIAIFRYRGTWYVEMTSSREHTLEIASVNIETQLIVGICYGDTPDRINKMTFVILFRSLL